MMGSMMADLKAVHQGINTSLKNMGMQELTEDELIMKLFREVEYIWPQMGYPPLVTPFSQYVKNVALMNIIQMTSGKERYGMIDNNTWDMILGKAGKLPGNLSDEIISIANKLGKEFYTGIPQDAYPDELDNFRAEMKKNGWDNGPDDEELFELAMHDRQYRDFKSGAAKARVENEVLNAKDQAKMQVTISIPGQSKTTVKTDTNLKTVEASSRGKVYYNLYGEHTEPTKEGDPIYAGDRLCYLQTSSNIEEILSPFEGEMAEIVVAQGSNVNKGEVLFKIKVKDLLARKKKRR